MPFTLALTSDKGGVGKSTLAVHLAGALAARGLRAVLIDEDRRMASCAAWAARGPGFAFAVLTPDEVRPKTLRGIDVCLIDTEGRPKTKDLVKLVKLADRVLVPTGTSPLELAAALGLFARLGNEGVDRDKLTAVVTRTGAGSAATREAGRALRAAGVRAASTSVRAYAAYVRAAELGVLVRDLPGPGAARAWSDIESLAREVAPS